MSIFVCDEDLLDHSPNNCGIPQSAGISAGAILKRGQTDITDYTNPTEWQTAIANGNAKIFSQVTIDLADGAPIQVDSKIGCGPAQRQVGVDYTATLIDENVSAENDEFYKLINGGYFDIVLFYCNENNIRVLPNAQVSVRIPQAVGRDADTQHYNGTFTWRYKNDDFGQFLDAPAGIFE